MARATSGAHFSPCTATGQISTWRGNSVGATVEDVADHRARGRGDDADHLRKEGERLLARLVEEPLGGEPGAASFSPASP